MRYTLGVLQALPPEAVDVVHEPMTERYFRASDKRKLIIKTGIFLGTRRAEAINAQELAMWMPNPSGGRRCGYYANFRLFYSAEGEPLSATLYCFYDGTHKSPCLRTQGSAHAYAKSEGFHAQEKD